MEISTAELTPIRELYGKGLYLQAYEQAQKFGPLREWSNTPARLLGGRLAIQLGGTKLGRWLHLKAYRNTPTHPEATYYHARFKLERFGPWSCWRFMRSIPDADWNDAAPEVRADWYGLHAFVCGRLRDFDRAERWLARAESITHDRAWIAVERAAVYEFAERWEDALAAARKSLELVPDFRPGVQAEAHILQMLGRDREALERLEAAASRIQSGIVVVQLAAMQMERRFYHDAQKSYQRYRELSPLLEKDTLEWLAAREADVSYFLGDLSGAIPHAEKASDDFYKEFAQRLSQTSAQSPTTIRHDLEGPLAFQEGPRTTTSALESLAKFWGMPTPTLADLTIFPTDGVPDYRERLWAENNGYVCKEFVMTPETAFALIERKLPFLFTMVDANYTYSQLVIGCDRLRNTLWLIDPSGGRSNEAPLRVIAERYGNVGPRALLIVPPEQAHLLEGIDFPSATQYDELHKIQTALQQHQRPLAIEAENRLKEHYPQDRITRLARLVIARYDSNAVLIKEALNSLLEHQPDDVNYLLSKASILRELNHREERRALAEREISKYQFEPIFAQHFAQTISNDPTRLSEGIQAMLKGVRFRSHAAVGYYTLGNLLWEDRNYQEAIDAHRFAACLEDRDETFAEAYFRAARATKQTNEAMRFLEARYQRTKGKFAAPARALFYSLSEQDRTEEAFKILEEVYATTPEPANRSEVGEVILFHAEMKTNYESPTEGFEILEKAKEFASRGQWLRSAARVSLIAGELAQAKKYWEELLTIEPLAVDVHRNLARAYSDIEGREAAVRWVREMGDRFPNFHPLQQFHAELLRSEPILPGEPPCSEPVVLRMIQNAPNDAWAHREYALSLAAVNRIEEGLEHVEIAKRIEPFSPSNYYTLGHLYHRADRYEDARDTYQEAIRQSVDNDVAIVELFNIARDKEERKEAIEFIADEFRRQKFFGDGLLTFKEQCNQHPDVIEPEDLMPIIQEIFDDHQEIWQAWSVLVQQLMAVERYDEAREMAKEATERFPLVSRVWLDLAEVLNRREDREGQIQALRETLKVAPGWSYAARELAIALAMNDQKAEAIVVLEQAIARAPLDPMNHAELAEHLWKNGEADAALDRLRVALMLDPGFDWAWRHLSMWAETSDQPERAVEVARAVTRNRPGDPRAWVALSRFLNRVEYAEEAIEALDKAIQLNPRNVEAYDLKAERLTELGRFDEAKESANPPIFADDPPLLLQGRSAWIEARRGNLAQACREMQALVNLEPTYFWGWQQLAEWYNESNRPVEYLEAAEKLVGLRPDNPYALATRGDARLQNDDRERAKIDLQEALNIDPSYSYPGLVLFDAHLQDQEFAQARSVLIRLEESVNEQGRPFILARYAQLAAKSNDFEAAANYLREVFLFLSDRTWPIKASYDAMVEAGWRQQADTILQEVLEKADSFHPWVLIAWLESQAGETAPPETTLRILERVNRIHPRNAQGFDVLAEMLTKLGRYEEAKNACNPPAFAGNPPLILKGRAAWVFSQEGDRETAIKKMQEVLAEDPDYYWGWQQLAGWLDEAGRYSEYLEAAENLVRIGKGEPPAYGFRAEAKLRLGDHRGAKADFQTAYDLDPRYAFAGLHLIDEQLADGEIDAATRTLVKLEEHVGGPYVQLRAIRLAIRKKDLNTAIEQFRSLASDPNYPPILVARAAEALSEAGLAAETNRVLLELIKADENATHLPRLWVERLSANQDFSFALRIPELKGPVRRETILASVDAFTSAKERRGLHQLIQDYGEELRSDNRSWCQVTEALVQLGDYQLAETWSADWQNRETTESSDLRAAVVARRNTGHIEQAKQIVQKVVEESESDNDLQFEDFLVWAAFETILEGNVEKTEEYLDLLDDADMLEGNLPLLLEMTEALLQIQKQGKAAVEQARQSVVQAFQESDLEKADPDLIDSYTRWEQRIAKLTGGFGAKIASLFKRKPKLPKLGEG
ncbi:MAG: tetratricopeptide repeat protein [Gemmataceae bacterium]|nr:tetratricopeptide repeat protein [Gemmataceae bacterium]